MRTYRNPITKKATDPTKFYVDPDELKIEIRKTQKKNRCTDRLAEMIVAISKNVIKFPRFRKFSAQDKEEALSFNYYRMCTRGIFTIDPDKNPFSYITAACYLNILRWRKEVDRRAENHREYIIGVIGKYENEFGNMPNSMRGQLNRYEDDLGFPDFDDED